MATFDLFRNNDVLNHNQFQRNNSQETIHKICIKNGVLTAILLIMSFISICALTHHLEINQLNVANSFILAFGIYFALEDYSPNGKSKSVDYFEGLRVGLYASFIAVLIHALFIGIYTTFDNTVLTHIKGGGLWKNYLDSFSAGCIILFEGLACSFIITFCIMQYFKKN